jgi:hypothetical protein
MSSYCQSNIWLYSKTAFAQDTILVRYENDDVQVTVDELCKRLSFNSTGMDTATASVQYIVYDEVKELQEGIYMFSCKNEEVSYIILSEETLIIYLKENDEKIIYVK